MQTYTDTSQRIHQVTRKYDPVVQTMFSFFSAQLLAILFSNDPTNITLHFPILSPLHKMSAYQKYGVTGFHLCRERY